MDNMYITKTKKLILPDDNYAVEITNARPSKNKWGSEQVILTYRVIEGPYINAELTDFVNAKYMQGSALYKICTACFGDQELEGINTQDLKHRNMRVIVVIDNKKGTNEQFNKVKSYMAMNRNVPTMQPQVQQPIHSYAAQPQPMPQPQPQPMPQPQSQPMPQPQSQPMPQPQSQPMPQQPPKLNFI